LGNFAAQPWLDAGAGRLQGQGEQKINGRVTIGWWTNIPATGQRFVAVQLGCDSVDVVHQGFVAPVQCGLTRCF
jgi:hypothetical protein